MRDDININTTDRMPHYLCCNGDEQEGPLCVALSNNTHQWVSKLSESWQQLDRLINDSTNASTAIFDTLQALYHCTIELTPYYALHPSLSLSKSLLEKHNISQLSLTHERNKPEFKNKLTDYMTELTSALNTAEHRAASARFDRLFRRKRRTVNTWLTHHLFVRGMTIININLYAPFHTNAEISLSQYSDALKHTIHAFNNKAPQQRGFDGYVWQLRQENNINYYVQILLAVNPSTPYHITIEKINHQWRASWQKLSNTPQFIPKPWLTNVHQQASSESGIKNQVNDITEAFCSLDSIIKLRIAKKLKTYHHSMLKVDKPLL